MIFRHQDRQILLETPGKSAALKLFVQFSWFFSQEEFVLRMREKIAQGDAISPEVGEEILNLADPGNNTGYAQELMQSSIAEAKQTTANLKKVYTNCARYK